MNNKIYIVTSGEYSEYRIDAVFTKEKKTVCGIRGSKQAGLCGEERSLISPDYARNFICDFILGKEQKNTQLTLF